MGHQVRHGPWLCLLASLSLCQGPLLSNKAVQGTWVSIVIDVYSTSQGEAKAKAFGEGAVQDLGRA